MAMNATHPLQRLPVTAFCIFVVVAGTLAGILVGAGLGQSCEWSKTSDEYGLPGMILGGIAGLLATAGWAGGMRHMALNHGGLGTVAAGTILGAVATVVYGSIVMTGLCHISGRPFPSAGSPVGALILGAFAGYFAGGGAWLAAALGRRNMQPTSPKPKEPLRRS